MFLASARQSENSRPLAFTVISVAIEGTKFHFAAPDSMLIARSDSLSVTLVFSPVMVHRPDSFETLTGGAPHCSRESFCAISVGVADVSRMMNSKLRLIIFPKSQVRRKKGTKDVKQNDSRVC